MNAPPAIRAPDPSFDEATKSAKTRAMIALLRDHFTPPRSILVVGCGSGLEAGALARAFDAETVGIDICDNFEFDHDGAAPATLEVMDARALEFPHEHFDFVYSFHALEHIPEPHRALAEMARVRKRGGHFIIGTPNRSRLVGYLGSPHPWRDKLRWNVADWRMRLQGKWTNEAGAHAGFSAPELIGLVHRAFGDVSDVSGDYYRRLYPRHAGKVDVVEKSGLKPFVFPCVYVAG